MLKTMREETLNPWLDLSVWSRLLANICSSLYYPMSRPQLAIEAHLLELGTWQLIVKQMQRAYTYSANFVNQTM